MNRVTNDFNSNDDMRFQLNEANLSHYFNHRKKKEKEIKKSFKNYFKHLNLKPINSNFLITYSPYMYDKPYPYINIMN